MKISQMIAAEPTAAADTPTFDHGDSADNPNPAPRAKRIKYKAAATNAPPMTAPQDTPDQWASVLPEDPARESTYSAEVKTLSINYTPDNAIAIQEPFPGTRLAAQEAMPLSGLQSCAICGAEGFAVSTPASQIKWECQLRKSFVLERMDHRPQATEAMDLTRFMHGGRGRLISCLNCGLLSREENADAHYDSDLYDPDLMRHLYPRYVRAFEEKKTQYGRLLRARADVLEVGSHLGAFLQTAEQWGWRPVGLDIGASTSTFSRRQGLSVKRMAIEDYLPRLRHDAVFIWNCFEQLDDPSSALRNSHRLLQPHGLLVVRVPNVQFYQHKRKQLKDASSRRSLRLLAYNNLLGFPYLHGYTPDLLCRLLRANGFNPMVSHNSNLLTPPYPDLSTKITKEWRAVRRETESSPTADGPWIEVVSCRA
jgi:SAM-dependent methyltransferase